MDNRYNKKIVKEFTPVLFQNFTFSPEIGSGTGSSTAACFRNTLPLVARNSILSNAIDFSRGTRPERNPKLTGFDWSADDSFIIRQMKLNHVKIQDRLNLKREFQNCTCSNNNGTSIESPPTRLDSNSLCCSTALLCAELKNSPAWQKEIHQLLTHMLNRKMTNLMR